MKQYLIALTAPSLGLMSEPKNHIKIYIVEAEDLNELGTYVDNQLMRQFALNFNVSLNNIKILFAAGIK